MSARRPTLFVTGFPPDIRAKDLAHEFEKFGEIIRCDVPAPAVGRSSRYAFIEYVSEEDAAKAHKNLHGENFEGSKLIVEWAKRTPGSRWRPGGPPPHRDDFRDSRGYSDRDRGDRGDRDRDREREREPPRGEYRERDRRVERERERPVDVRRERDVRERSRSPRRGTDRERAPRDDRPREERPPRDDRERGGERMERGEYARRSPRGGDRRREDVNRDRDRDVEMVPARRSATPPPKGTYENGRY